MDTTEESPIILSLCTGIRGLEKGVERAIGKIRIAAYVEVEAFIIENLLAGMEAGILDATPVWANLKTFPWQSFHGKIHGIIGGYPCQPFSVAGKQRGEEDPRHLWPYIAEGIRAVRPLWCFFENVPGHINVGYEAVRRELQEMDYHVEEGIFSAEEIGAPHRRERLFILAILANAYSDESERNGESSAMGSKTTTHKRQENQRKWIWDAIRYGSSVMANTNQSRLQVATCIQFGSIQQKERTFQGCKFSGIFPAPPREQQYEYEEPRIIKPGVGCTIDGYNFREDILRALGNGVVEQTAELAFNELLRKHYR